MCVTGSLQGTQLPCPYSPGFHRGMRNRRCKWDEDTPLFDDPQAPLGVPMLIGILAIGAILWAALK